MLGRPMWAWLKHRNEELRCPGGRVTNEEFNDSMVENNYHQFQLTEEMYSRPWGGIPFVYSMGDSQQLPPVAQKASYDISVARGGSDQLGKNAYYELLNPPDSDEVMTTIVFMKHVLRQRDPMMLNLLLHMRNGEMNDNDVQLMLSRVLEDMPDEE